jgi:hypothetical protein
MFFLTYESTVHLPASTKRTFCLRMGHLENIKIDICTRVVYQVVNSKNTKSSGDPVKKTVQNYILKKYLAAVVLATDATKTCCKSNFV